MNHANPDEKILLNRAVGTPGDGASLSNFTQVVGHQCHIRSLECRLCACRAHGYPDICHSECGSVVDAISYHCHFMAAGLKLTDDLEFIIWHQISKNLVHTQLLANAVANRGVIAGQQDDTLDAARAKLSDCGSRIWAQGVCEMNDSKRLSVTGNMNDCLLLRLVGDDRFDAVLA